MTYYENECYTSPTGMCYITQPCYEQGANVWAQCEYCGVCYNVFLTPRDSYGGGVDMNQCRKEITKHGKMVDFLKVYDWALFCNQSPTTRLEDNSGVGWLGNACCRYTDDCAVADAYNYAESPIYACFNDTDCIYCRDWLGWRHDQDFALALNPFEKERMCGQVDYLSIYGNWKEDGCSGYTCFGVCDCRCTLTTSRHSYCAKNGKAWECVGNTRYAMSCCVTDSGWLIPYERPYACGYLCMSDNGVTSEVYNFGGELYDGAGCSCVCCGTVTCTCTEDVCKMALVCCETSVLLRANGDDYLYFCTECETVLASVSMFGVLHSNGDDIREICPTAYRSYMVDNNGNNQIVPFTILCLPQCKKIYYATTFHTDVDQEIQVPANATIESAKAALLTLLQNNCPADYQLQYKLFEWTSQWLSFRIADVDEYIDTANIESYVKFWLYAYNQDLNDFCVTQGYYTCSSGGVFYEDKGEVYCFYNKDSVTCYYQQDVCGFVPNDGSCYVWRDPCETDGVLYFGLPNYAVGSIPIKRIKCVLDYQPSTSYIRNESERVECWSARDMAFDEPCNKYKFCFITFPNCDPSLIANVPKMMSCAVWYYLCSYKCEAGQYVQMCKTSLNMLDRDVCGSKMTYYSFQGYSVGGAYIK